MVCSIRSRMKSFVPKINRDFNVHFKEDENPPFLFLQ